MVTGSFPFYGDDESAIRNSVLQTPLRVPFFVGFGTRFRCFLELPKSFVHILTFQSVRISYGKCSIVTAPNVLLSTSILIDTVPRAVF